MSHDSEASKPGLPAVAATPGNSPGAVFRVRIQPSPELLQLLKDNPEAKLTIRLPGDPGYAKSAEVQGPAFSMQSWREDNHVCPHCSGLFSIAYCNPSNHTSGIHNIAVRCPECRGIVAAAVPAEVNEDAIEVRLARRP
jgi:hypothetical protein